MKNLAKLILLTVTVTLLLPLLASAQVSGTAPQTFWRETDQTLPLGLHRIRIENNQFVIQSNGSADGSFGVTTTVFSYTGGIVSLFTATTSGTGVSLYAGVVNIRQTNGGSGIILSSLANSTVAFWKSVNASTDDSIQFGTLVNGNIDFYTNNTKKAQLSTGGQLLLSDGSAASPSISFINGASTGLLYVASNTIDFSTGGTAGFRMNTAGLYGASTQQIGWLSGAVGSAVDLVLVRDAAHVMAIKDGANANELRIYGTTTGPVYARIISDAGNHYLASSGDFPWQVYINSANRWTFGSSSSGYAIAPITDNTYDIGTSLLRGRSVVLGTSLSVGTNPATVGAVRLANTGAINFRNALNTLDLNLISSDASNNVVVGTTSGGVKIVSGGTTDINSKFIVDVNGNITKINNVTTSYPASQGAANTLLANDGSGNLTWVDNSGGMASRVSTQFDKTSSTVLSDITGLSATVTTGRTYEFEAILYTTSNIAGGVKFSVSDGGFVIASSIIYEAVVYSAAGIVGQSRAPAINTAVGGVTAVTAAMVRITGTITVSTGGPLRIGFAQNTSNGTASSILVGSTFRVNDIS